MPGKRKSKQRQQALTSLLLPEIKVPASFFGKSICVPGSYWEGSMSADERMAKYKCTVRNFSYAHKFQPGSTPSKAWELMEMGEGGRGSLELGDASGEKFWMSNNEFF